MNKDFLEGLASLVNVKAEDVAELFVTEGEETKLKEDVKPLEVVKGWVKTRLDDTYKAAERKTASRFEGWVKNQGFESESYGTNLLDEYFESVKTKPGEGGGDPSEWEKKYNDLAPKLENLQKALSDKDGLLVQKENEWNKRFVTSQLSQNVRSALGEKWAGSDAHFNILMNNFDASRIKYEGDNPVLLDDSGEPLKDDLHRPVVFKDHVLGLGELIGGFHAVDPKLGGAPPPKGGEGGEGAIKLKDGLSDREFNSMYDSEHDPAKRLKLAEARAAQLEAK